MCGTSVSLKEEVVINVFPGAVVVLSSLTKQIMVNVNGCAKRSISIVTIFIRSEKAKMILSSVISATMHQKGSPTIFRTRPNDLSTPSIKITDRVMIDSVSAGST